MKNANLNNQEWRPIKGFPGYYVDIYGNVLGLKGSLLKPQNNNGYISYRVIKDRHVKTVYAHRLIAEAFIPNPNNYPCINHKDGNKINNSIDNLEWCTYKQNSDHALRTGLRPSVDKSKIRNMFKEGYSHEELADKFNLTTGTVCAYTRNIRPRGKLKEEDKIEIKTRYLKGATLKTLADMFNVSIETIKRTLKGLYKRHKNLTSEEKEQIRALYVQGYTDKQIKEMFGIKQSTLIKHTKGLRKRKTKAQIQFIIN